MGVQPIYEGSSDVIVGRYDDVRGAVEFDSDFRDGFVYECGSFAIPSETWRKIGALDLNFIGVRVTSLTSYDPADHIDGALVYSAPWRGFTAHAHDSYRCNDRQKREPRETHLAASAMTVRREPLPARDDPLLTGAERDAVEAEFGRGRWRSEQGALL